MTDFDDLFDSMVDESAARRAPVDLVETRAREHRGRERRRHRVQGFVVGALAIALVAGVLSLARSGPSESAPAAHTAASTTTPTARPGWTTYDYGLARLSIPPGWTAYTGCPAAYALTMTDPSVDSLQGCSPSSGDGPSIAIQPYTPPRDTVHQPFMPTAEVNGFPYELVIPKCLNCAGEWVNIEKLGVTITFRGRVDMNAVLKTLTYSTYARLLQQPFGPTPASWKTITFDGVAVRVPRTWKVVDLTHTGFCGPAPETAYVGSPGFSFLCPPPPALARHADSLQLETAGISQPVAPEVTHHDLRFSLQIGGAPLADVMTYRVTGGAKPVSVTVGLGLDPAIARGILGSIRLAG